MEHTTRVTLAASPGIPRRQAGFTLVELLITVMLAGILSAVALPMYLGYTKDAQTAEAKGMASSALTALQGCVQPRTTGATCDLSNVAHRIGVDASTGTTGDGRWTVTEANLTLVSTSPLTLSGTIGVVGVSGRATDGIGIGMYVNPTGVVLRCNMTGNTVPASNAGDSC